jgi:hypothetical protein
MSVLAISISESLIPQPPTVHPRSLIEKHCVSTRIVQVALYSTMREARRDTTVGIPGIGDIVPFTGIHGYRFAASENSGPSLKPETLVFCSSIRLEFLRGLIYSQ